MPLLIKAGTKLDLTSDRNISIKPTQFPTNYDNFFDMVDVAVEWQLITDQTRDRIFDIVKKESPKVFDNYLTDRTARKYNI